LKAADGVKKGGRIIIAIIGQKLAVRKQGSYKVMLLFNFGLEVRMIRDKGFYILARPLGIRKL
jgi:hypothetical protein